MSKPGSSHLDLFPTSTIKLAPGRETMDEFSSSFMDGATTTQGISHAMDPGSQAFDSRTQTHARVINGLTEDDAREAASDVLEEFLAEMSAARNVALPSLS